MAIRWSERFHREWKKLPPEIKTKAGRILILLDTNREHPSLRLKKLQRIEGFWELRVDRGWRILLTIEEEIYVLAGIGRHDVLDKYGRN
jgi:mRNA-degrading endonuclease RelE of RelBE toxin-antitoxin system